jgi:uncharacterized protein
MAMKLIDKVREIQKIDTWFYRIGVYDRRRVGKTFLIRDYFKNEFDFLG